MEGTATMENDEMDTKKQINGGGLQHYPQKGRP
jgi:hypothetical protein